MRTSAISCDFRIVLSNGRALFSAGWNDFVKVNKLQKDDSLDFNLLEEGGNWVFLVEVTRKRQAI